MIKGGITMTDIFRNFLSKCDNDEDLLFFFEGYLECLIGGANAMYWNIPNDDTLKDIKNFFAEIYKDNLELYSISLWKNYDNTRKEYEIVWYYSLEHKKSLNR